MAIAQHYITDTTKLLLHKSTLELDIKHKQRLLTRLKYAQGPGDVKAIRYDYIPSPRPNISDIDIMFEIDRLAREIDIIKLEIISIDETLDEIENIPIEMPDTLYTIFRELYIVRRNMHCNMTQKVEDVAYELGFAVGTVWNKNTEIKKIIREELI